jgi:transposase
VVLDESYATTTFTRTRGRCSVDQRLRQSVPAGHWKCLTILGAININGVVTAASVNAATDTQVFRTFIDDFLIPKLRPGMVVVMDNLAAHKVCGVKEALQAAGCRVVYLPPYSPDMSPIEPIWSKAKSVIRMLEARTLEDLEAAVTLAMDNVTAENCRNCFADCGYSLHLK